MILKSRYIKDWDNYAIFWDKVMLNYPDYNKLKRYHIDSLINKKIILDAGAGTGNVTCELLKRGHKVYAVDISKDSLRILQKKSKKYSKDLFVKKEDILKFTYRIKDEFFDGINLMVVLPFIEKPIEHLKEFYRILRKSGVLALSTNDPKYKDNFGCFIKEIKKYNKYNKGTVSEKDLNIFEKKAIYNFKIKAKNWFRPEQLKKQLLKIGFRKVSQPKYVGKRITYFLKIKK